MRGIKRNGAIAVALLVLCSSTAAANGAPLASGVLRTGGEVVSSGRFITNPSSWAKAGAHAVTRVTYRTASGPDEVGVRSGPTLRPYAAVRKFSRRRDAGVGRIRFEASVLAPIAFMRFCLRYAEDCKVRPTASPHGPVKLTDERRDELVAVNRSVNRSIKPQENLKGVTAEEWLVSPRKGDCNDYAVTKRHELLARGWPSRSLLLAEAIVASGEHHLVLVARTRDGDFVLDNLNWDVRPVAQIRYQWVRAQEPKNPKFWSKISVARTSRVATNAW